eukprot:INCI14900.1.p1 GENE.INCI14900.1~~INCI14900.1.p1  ORF type:complete len:325 (+),score=39.34 INCI14900.1:103-1077(+)
MSTFTYETGEVNQEGLDRNLELPCSTLFKLFQSARMRLPWIGAAYEAFRAESPEDPARRLVVKSQGLMLTDAALVTSPLHRAVRTAVQLAEVGKTSIEFRYNVYFDNILVARGCAVMVSVTGPAGALQPTPVPRRIADMARTALPSQYLFANKADLRRALAPAPAPAFAPSAGDPPLTFETTFVVRFSDEDANKHANHTFLIRLVEDTLACAHATQGKVAALAKFFIYNKLAGVAMEYLHEARAMDVVRVQLTERWTDEDEAIASDASAMAAGTDVASKSEIEFSVRVSKIVKAVKGTVADTVLARGVVVLTASSGAVDSGSRL